ncbi:MAG: NADH-quinone oxidoreductase subunit N [Anaerolineaceae bacterium]|nr:NADH-quinone oxidoreductase subunit N [Anaerolineaceae bacterium]
MTGAFELSMIPAVLPEIMLILLAVLVLVLDLVYRDRENSALGWITAIGLLVAAGLGVAFSRPASEPVLLFGGMLRQDWLTFTFRLIFMVGAALTALVGTEKSGKHLGEYYLLLIISTLGMSLMASSANLIMLYLAIETTSIPLYILAGFKVTDQKSVEAGIKYLLFGAMTSAVMLYGFSLLWGFSGTTSLYELADALKAGSAPPVLMGGLALLVLVGFGFKVSAAPLHFWAPDVYEGAPTPVAGFLSTASKAAGFAVLARVLLAVFPDSLPFWTVVIAVLATVSMILGNVLALVQRNIKRLLAYSSIAQAGYILVGVAAGNELGVTGVVYYLASYLVTNLAAFGIVWLVGRQVGSDDLDAYAGLGKRNPAVALAMLLALLSLGGVPPLSGFFGKLLVFGAAVQAGQFWLAFVGVITSVIGLYYYLTVMKIMYRPGTDEQPLPMTPAWRTALLACVAGMIFLGVAFAPWYGWATAAAGSLF